MAVMTKEQLKQYCLRELGAPVIQINVADEQLEDRMGEALEYFREYHSDGVEKVYLKHQITAEDVQNQFIPLNDLIYGISRVIPLNNGTSSSNLFDIQYQLRLNDLFNLTSTSLIYYTTAMEHLATLDFVLNGHQLIRFNRFKNKLELDAKWGKTIVEGQYIIVEAYRAMDPDEYMRIWANPWLKKYTTALFKRQWGNNIKKYNGMQLPGGIVIDGQRIYDEALEEIKELEQELIEKAPTLDFFVG